MGIKRIFLTSRPIMWSWLVLAYLVGVGNFSHFTWVSWAELILFTFPLNFYLYGLNDCYDMESDRMNARKGGAQGIAPDDREIRALRRIVWIPPVLFLGVAAFGGSLEHFLLSLLFVALCFTYSHPAVRAKGIPILDCLNSGAGYCLPGFIAYSLHASLLTLPPIVYLIVVPYMGIHAVTTLIDEKVDRAAGMTTIGVAFGKRGTVLFSLLTFAAGLVVFRAVPILASVLIVSLMNGIVFLFSNDERDDALMRFAAPAVLISFVMVTLVYFIVRANVA